MECAWCSYIQEVVVGAKLSGKLIRGKPYVSEEEKERLAEEKIAMVNMDLCCYLVVMVLLLL